MSFIKKIFVGVLVAAGGISACSPFSIINSLANRKNISVYSGVSYGPHKRQRLDVYRPNQYVSTIPTILFFYGGSWKRGSRKNYEFVGNALAHQGFVVVVADYRLYPEVKFPAFVDDGALALAWTAKNIGKYGGSTYNIHLVGHSAGAHIASLLVLDKTYVKNVGLKPNILGRWVGLSGPYAFYPSKVQSIKNIFSDVSEEIARPITMVAADVPDALLIHGADDKAVLPKNSKILAQRLNKFGNRAFAVLYEKIGHGLIIASLTFPFGSLAPTLQDITLFLKTGKFPPAKAYD